MDLNNLRKLSQDGQDGIGNQILQKCAPGKIAQELLNKLNDAAKSAAKRGERTASVGLRIWDEEQNNIETVTVDGFNVRTVIAYGEVKKSGPIVDVSEREKASEILLQMVREHISDENIKLALDAPFYYSGSHYSYQKYQVMRASVEW